jgi:hypothetical protein
MKTIKSIPISLDAWAKLYTQLARDNPPSVILIREKMREVLGVTPRNYYSWEPGMVNKIEYIILDFFDEKKKTMFLLKYSHFLEENLRKS